MIIWGWGHEDKELQNRSEHFNYSIEKIIKFHEFERKAKFFKIFQDNHIREESGKWNDAYIKFKQISINDKNNNINNNNINNNGLNTLKYEIIKEINLHDNVKKITVEIL